MKGRQISTPFMLFQSTSAAIGTPEDTRDRRDTETVPFDTEREKEAWAETPMDFYSYEDREECYLSLDPPNFPYTKEFWGLLLGVHGSGWLESPVNFLTSFT